MADNVHSVIEAWTGMRPISCPWAAFRDAFVMRVFQASAADVSEAWSQPDPSNRLVEGVLHFKRALVACRSKRREQESNQPKTQPRPGREVLRG